MPSIVATIERKIAVDVAGFDELSLLVSSGIPELGAVISTFVMTAWLTAAALNDATSGMLHRSSYARAFLHAIIGTEDALYEWTPQRQWVKHANPG